MSQGQIKNVSARDARTAGNWNGEAALLSETANDQAFSGTHIEGNTVLCGEPIPKHHDVRAR